MEGSWVVKLQHQPLSSKNTLQRVFNRNEHDIGYILDTIRNNVTTIEQYFSFGNKNNFGEKIITFCSHIINNNEFNMTNIYTYNNVQQFVTNTLNELDKYIKEQDVIPTWIMTWYDWTAKGFNKATSLSDIQAIIQPTVMTQTPSFIKITKLMFEPN